MGGTLNIERILGLLRGAVPLRRRVIVAHEQEDKAEATEHPTEARRDRGNPARIRESSLRHP